MRTGEKVEIKRISGNEIWVGPNKTSLIFGKIIHVIADGEQTTVLAETQYKINKELADSVSGKIHFLIDLNKAKKNSPEARLIWKKSSEDEKTDKLALYGLHPVARVLASFVIGISRNKNMRFFKAKDDALDWLLSK